MTSEDKLSRPLTPDLKLRLANFVNENKSILFGRVTPTLRNIDKMRKWKSIYEELIAHGAVIKDPAYLRDRMWDGLKRGVMEKRKKFASTGAAGGNRYTDFEKVTLEIMDPDSAHMSGLGQRELPPIFPGSDGGAQGDVSDDLNTTTQSVFNTTSQSAFNANLTTMSSAPTFARPADRTSSPVRGNEASTAPAPKRPKRSAPTNLWASDSYKELKIRQMEKELEEQEVRITLMRTQTEESRLRCEAEIERCQAEKERASFFSKAGLAVENNYILEINREHRIHL